MTLMFVSEREIPSRDLSDDNGPGDVICVCIDAKKLLLIQWATVTI